MAKKNELYPKDTPQVIRDFLNYLSSVRGRSDATIKEYFLDLRTFFRFIKQYKGIVQDDVKFSNISINDIDIDFIRSITLSDMYEFMIFVKNERPTYHKSNNTTYGNNSSTRSRKTASIRSFYKYLVSRNLIETNIAAELEPPQSTKNKTPKSLSLDECRELLNSVYGNYKERDYCILVLFLNCGLRVSELVGINIHDIFNDYIIIRGKGNKERIVYLNDASIDALDRYLKVRIEPKKAQDKQALFTSRLKKRINVQTVKWIVKKYLSAAGLSASDYSAHKLRHTAATLLYANGADIRTIQEFLGHEQLNTTMIYTHVSNESQRQLVKLNPLSDIHVSKESLLPDDTDKE